MKEQLLSDDEIVELLSETHECKTTYDEIQYIYKKGYDQAIADMLHVEKNGVVMP